MQRYDKLMLPALLAFNEDGSLCEPIGTNMENSVSKCTAKVLDIYDGFSPWGGPQKYQRIEVTTPTGWLVPAYRVYVPSENYVICQSFTHKAVKL